MTTLMASTLPTIVGMGVVTKTVETTMGGKKKKSSRNEKKRTIRIYQGKRGGTYVIRKGQKVYI